MKNDRAYINELLERYFEGQTTLQEERVLRKYFQQKKIDEAFEIYRPIFGFFSREIGEEAVANKQGKFIFIRWISVGVAACIVLFFGLRLAFYSPEATQSQSIVYISGKAYTNNLIISEEVLNSIENISDQSQDVISSQIDVLDTFIN